VLRRILGSKREEGDGDWRRLHNEKLCNFYASPNIRSVKPWSMRWAGHVALMGEIRNRYSILFGKHEGRDHLGHLAIDGKIMLEGILEKWGERMLTGCSLLRIGMCGRLL